MLKKEKKTKPKTKSTRSASPKKYPATNPPIRVQSTLNPSDPGEKMQDNASKPFESISTQDIALYPFLVKTLITYTKLNSQGNEEKIKDEVVFKLDRPSVQMPWYVLRNYSVPRYLVSTYGPHEVAWQRIYEIKILKIINRTNPNDITDIPLRVMTISQLEQFCKKWELNVPVYEFYSVEKAREMVALRQDDPKGFEKHLAEYREGKQRSYPELDNMRKNMGLAIADKLEFDRLDNNQIAKKATKTPLTAQVIPTLSELRMLEENETLPMPSDSGGTLKDPFEGM